jgi:hypothetical protein
LIAYSVIGIALLGAGTIWAGFRETKDKKTRYAIVALSSGAAILSCVLLYKPELSGPTQLVEWLFAWASV